MYIVYQSFQNTSGKLFRPGYSLSSYTTALKRMGDAIPNTFIIGGIALVAVVFIAIIIAYLVVRRSNVITTTIDTISMLPYIIPGSVVGIALVMAFNKKPLVLTGTVTIMVLSPVHTTSALYDTVLSGDSAANPDNHRGSGDKPRRIEDENLFQDHRPDDVQRIISGAIISWVMIITELSTAIILYNSRTITLTLAIYTFVTRGNYGYAAALATVLTALTVISLSLFMKFSKSKEITF